MKKLWNRPDYPVWSISTYSPKDGRNNMNICTYAIAASMKPKEFMVAIYHNTCTHKLAQTYPYILMQLLSKNHHDVVRRFGFQSGKNKNKFNRMKHPLEYTKEQFTYMSDILGMFYGEIIDWMPAGDHDIARVRILWTKNLNTGDPLMNSDLKKHGIIR